MNIFTYYKFPHGLKYLPKMIRRKIVKVYQRIRRGWADEDTWNFDLYLTNVIGNGLLHLAKNSNGYPPELDSYEEWQRLLTYHGETILKYNTDEDSVESPAYARRLQQESLASLRWVASHIVYLWD